MMQLLLEVWLILTLAASAPSYLYISNIPLDDFVDAWKESQYYMIQVLQSVEEYAPHPIDVDSVPLDADLEELQEAIAENAHDVWAAARMKEGWSYGPKITSRPHSLQRLAR